MVGHSISSLTIQEHNGDFPKRPGTPRPTGPNRTGRDARNPASALASHQRRELSVTATTATQSETVRITGPTIGAQDRVLTPQAVEFLVKLSTLFEQRRRRLLGERGARSATDPPGRRVPGQPLPPVRAAPAPVARGQTRPPAANRPRRTAGLSGGDSRYSPGGLEDRGHAGRSAGPPRGDYRSHRPQDDYQRPQFRR